MAPHHFLSQPVFRMPAGTEQPTPVGIASDRSDEAMRRLRNPFVVEARRARR